MQMTNYYKKKSWFKEKKINKKDRYNCFEILFEWLIKLMKLKIKKEKKRKY